MLDYSCHRMLWSYSNIIDDFQLIESVYKAKELLSIKSLIICSRFTCIERDREWSSMKPKDVCQYNWLDYHF